MKYYFWIRKQLCQAKYAAIAVLSKPRSTSNKAFNELIDIESLIKLNNDVIYDFIIS